jgi:hypothetical protein
LEPLEHLTRRGYVYYDRGWHLVNNSFTRFVLTAENPEQIAQWLAEASESTWKYLRIPIYAVVIALVAIVVYSASDALDSAVAILTGIIGLIPLAMRSFSIFKGGHRPHPISCSAIRFHTRPGVLEPDKPQAPARPPA